VRGSDGQQFLSISLQQPPTGGVRPLFSTSSGCAGLPADEREWPAFCLDGYDANFDIGPTEQELNAQYGLYWLEALYGGILEYDHSHGSGAYRCDAERYAFYFAASGFVWYAGETIFWGAGMKNIPRTAMSLRNSGVALIATNIARMAWDQCLMNNRW